MSDHEMTEILDELEDLAGWFGTRGDPLNAKFLRDLKARFVDMDLRLAVVNQQMTTDKQSLTVAPPADARCPGQEREPFGVQPQCLDCKRYSSASMELTVDWIDPPAGDPCPQHAQ